MAILKNELLFPFKKRDYAKPHHIVVSGSDEEIGYDLACLAKEKYDCTLEKYDDPIHMLIADRQGSAGVCRDQRTFQGIRRRP